MRNIRTRARITRIGNRSVLRKLTLSYVVLIVVLAAVIGVTAHGISAVNYNMQVARLNQQLLGRYATIINDNIIVEAQRTHLYLCLNLNLKTDIEILFAPVHSLGKMITLYGELNQIVSSSNKKIEAIHVQSIPHGFHLSSMAGLKYRDEINMRTLPNLYWSPNPDQRGTSSVWLPARSLEYSTMERVNVVSYVATFPATRSFSQAKGIITIDLREDYVRGILEKVGEPGTDQAFILDQNGILIAHSSHPIPATVFDLGYTSAHIDGWFARDSGNRVVRLQDGAHMVNHVALSNGWRLVQSVPLRDFYSVARTITLNNLIISLIAVALSLMMMRLYARKLYHPLSSIMDRFRTLLHRGEEEGMNRDEYAIIERALNDMRDELITLSRMRERSLPLLKESLLLGLINETTTARGAYERLLQHTGEPSVRGRSMVFLLDWSQSGNSLETIRTQVSEETLQVLTAHVEKRMSRKGLGSGTRIAFSGSISSVRLGVLIVEEEDAPPQTFDSLVAEAQEILGISTVLALGSWRASPLDSGQSCRDAARALEYRYFYPDRQVFDSEDFPFCDMRSEPDFLRLIARYADALKTNDEKEVRQLIRDLCRRMVTEPIPAEYRRRYLHDSIQLFFDHARTCNISAADPLFQIKRPVEQLADIHALENWWLQASVRLLELKQRTSRHTVEDVVGSMKKYIMVNLSGELSLTRLSEFTGLSRSYLSHVFRESTGVNLVNYITDQRMLRARTLLKESDLNIETIARNLGYETPHYFSKRFKQHFGTTPSSFRFELTQGASQ